MITKIKSSMNDIPCEVLFYILSMLPLKYLMKLKRVCKTWCLLINELFDLHVKHMQNTYHGILLFHVRHSSDDTVEATISALRIGLSPEIIGLMTLTHGRTRPYQHFHMMQSVNGLICVTNQEVFTVCNPLTKEVVTLPICRNNPVPRHDHPSHRVPHGFGFGYNSSTKEYKVVKIYNFVPNADDDVKKIIRYECAVFTLGSKSNSWRNIEGPSYPVCVWFGAISLDGALYWIVRREGKMLMTFFDIDKEKFTSLEILGFLANQKVFHFGVVQGRVWAGLIQPMEGEDYNDIWICNGEPERNVEIWIMVDDYGHHWVKKHVILHEEYHTYWIPTVDCLIILDEERLLLQRQSFGAVQSFAFYNLKSKVYEDFEILTGHNYRGAIRYSWESK
ncbi:hypothetical protein CCACVL1_06074 [Corchorus capsularis]|uniref:F-box domain-containing protein n=1 Tax=Corchorus capsularis TaxID=210143 RepID=A0A1R3JHI3_COCAP|nr:hypothetical protein CCACVL1_06074 [Corchorus capsularis]